MWRPTAIVIGNFDGVHLGHRALFHAARETVGAGGRVVALAFDPHPLSVISPPNVPPVLQPFDQRERDLLAAGADAVCVLRPTERLLSQEPGDFLADLVRDHRPSHMVEGPDFRFGRRREGGVDTLRAMGERLGFETVVIKPVRVALTDHALVPVSSTLIRWLVCRGRVRDAARALGRWFEIESTVEPGHRRGREIGFPTANLASTGGLLPHDGVYRGRAVLPDGSSRIAAISVGVNPTFRDDRRVCEAHLIDYDGPLDDYGWSIRLGFCDWLRDQVAYRSAPALVAQLRRDVDRCRSLAHSARPLSV